MFLFVVVYLMLNCFIILNGELYVGELWLKYFLFIIFFDLVCVMLFNFLLSVRGFKFCFLCFWFIKFMIFCLNWLVFFVCFVLLVFFDCWVFVFCCVCSGVFVFLFFSGVCVCFCGVVLVCSGVCVFCCGVVVWVDCFWVLNFFNSLFIFIFCVVWVFLIVICFGVL